MSDSAKSLNPCRYPPRVFIVGGEYDDENSPDPVEGIMSECNWSDMNADVEPVLVPRDWPAPVARAGRVTLEIREPVRPYGIELVMQTASRPGSLTSRAPWHAFAPAPVPSTMIIVDFLDARNPQVREPRRIHEHLLPRKVRLYRESLVESPGATRIDLLPVDEAAEELVAVSACWQERAIHPSEEQHGIADTAPDPRSTPPGEPIDAHVSASWLFHFVNR